MDNDTKLFLCRKFPDIVQRLNDEALEEELAVQSIADTMNRICNPRHDNKTDMLSPEEATAINNIAQTMNRGRN